MQEVYHKITSNKGLYHSVKHSVWLTNEQLLMVKESIFHQSYKKFFLRDIQSFLIIENKKFKKNNIIFLILQAFYFLFVSLSLNAEWIFLWIFLSLINLVIIGYNLNKGKTCELYLKTATSFTQVSAVTRLKQAKKFITFLEPLILNAQSKLGIDVAEILNSENDFQSESQDMKIDIVKEMIPDPPDNQVSGNPVLEYLLTTNILLHALSFVFPLLLSMNYSFAPPLILSFSGFVLLVMNIVKSGRSERKKTQSGLNKISYIYLSLILLLYFTMYIIYIFILEMTTKARESYNLSMVFLKFLSLNVQEYTAIQYVNVFFALITLILGLIGVKTIISQNIRKRRK